MFLFPLAVLADWQCPSHTNTVEFKSPITEEVKKWCQLNKNGKFLKHGPLAVFKDGKLIKSEYYLEGVLQKVGSFNKVAGEGTFYMDSYLACELAADQRKAKCYLAQAFPHPNHVFHSPLKFYEFEFPYRVKYLVNDYLSLCGVKETDGDLVCFDPSFFKLKERLKNEKFELLDGAYVFKEIWPDGESYQRRIAKEYLDKVIIDKKNPNYIVKKLRPGQEVIVHQNYACVLDQQQELDCFSRPSYGNKGRTFYQEKPFPSSSFIGASFSHLCVLKEKYARCFYFVPQYGHKQEAYLLEKLKFVGPFDSSVQKMLYRDTLIWIDFDEKLEMKQLKSQNPNAQLEFRKLTLLLKNVKGVKQFAIHADNFCYLDQEGELFCLLKKIQQNSRLKQRGGYQQLKSLFPKKRFQRIYQASFGELVGQFCLKYQSSAKYFCFNPSSENRIGREINF